jgi:hypothetical protein
MFLKMERKRVPGESAVYVVCRWCAEHLGKTHCEECRRDLSGLTRGDRDDGNCEECDRRVNADYYCKQCGRVRDDNRHCPDCDVEEIKRCEEACVALLEGLRPDLKP